MQPPAGMPNELTAPALNEITKKIIGAAIEVHRVLGPGLLEAAYHACLSYELQQANLRVEARKSIPLVYKGIQIKRGYFADLIVEDAVVVELKAVDALAPIHRQQLLTYLRITDCRVGLVLNFGGHTMTEGIERVVNKFPQV